MDLTQEDRATLLLALRIVGSDAVADLLATRGIGDGISDEAADLYRKLRSSDDEADLPFDLAVIAKQG